MSAHRRVVAALVGVALAATPGMVEAQTQMQPTAAPATSPVPNGPPAAPQPTLEDLRAQLDALQRQNAAQQAELERLRTMIEGQQPAANANQQPQNPAGAAAVPPGPAAPPGGATLQQPNPTPTPAGVRSAPVAGSVESVYQQQNAATFVRKLTITPSFAQTYSDSQYFTLNGFLALGAVFLGNIDVTQQRSDLSILNVDGTYGLSDRLSLEASLPYYLRSSTFSSVGANETGSQPSQNTVATNAFGDAQLGAYYRIQRETLKSPGITLNAHVSIPTGVGPFGIKLASDQANSSLMYPQKLPTGSGVFGYQVGAAFVKTDDPAIFFGGVNYYIQTPGHFADLSVTQGTITPGTALPGNGLQYQLGTAFALNDKTSLSFAFSDTITQQIRLKPDGGAYSSVIASGTNAAVFDISTGFAYNEHQTIVTDIGLGLTRDAPNFQLNLRFPHQF
jgi:hypothetical protein